ncbi:hypothetical protein PoB_007364000 [Plakobranchus ocellatus]|uniref:Uncharacterized protein n=1 Tax=Plakobranchus ocellatus TaxID=259542 RepID=A0AAV4DT25_9GAST|nr:hypothetical protein PoB_007364000 [Plakobranchus ocellatus]
MDKKNLSVEWEKYTVWRVVLGSMDCVKPVIRKIRALTIPIVFWFAALIFIEVGVRWELFNPSRFRKEVLTRQDWQPVSATARMVVVLIGPHRVDSIFKSLASDGRACISTWTVG